MKHTIFNVLALLAGTSFSLTIPGILPDLNNLLDPKEHDRSSLKLGCITSIAIGFLFASLLIVWIGLVTYHTFMYLLHPPKVEDAELVAHRNARKTDAEKSEEEEKVSWGDSYGAGPILGTLFGIIFTLWGLLFVWNTADAIDILGKIWA